VISEIERSPDVELIAIGIGHADLLLYSEFESWPALQGYEAHPLHHELRELIAPLRIERRVVDYQT
jgi:hypothetical protein